MAAELKPADLKSKDLKAPDLKSVNIRSQGRRVLYLYGVTQAQPAKTLRHVGVDLQSPVESVECEGVVCWISRVSAEKFETSLTANMENLDWLTTASVAHQRAIGALAQQISILPARFGTVFRDERSLCAHIRERMGALAKDFKRVKDADEWGIKIFETAPTAAAVPKVSSGKDYLVAKAAMLPRKKSAQIPEEEISEFENALAEVAEESAAAGRISSGQRGLLFQTSLLVKRRNRQRLQSVLKKFSRKWEETRRIECTGPWPPYSFVSQDLKSR
jgi:hypothetical protein